MSAISRELSERDAKIDALSREVEQLRAWQRARLETDDAARNERDALVKALTGMLDEFGRRQTRLKL